MAETLLEYTPRVNESTPSHRWQIPTLRDASLVSPARNRTASAPAADKTGVNHPRGPGSRITSLLPTRIKCCKKRNLNAGNAALPAVIGQIPDRPDGRASLGF